MKHKIFLLMMFLSAKVAVASDYPEEGEMELVLFPSPVLYEKANFGVRPSYESYSAYSSHAEALIASHIQGAPIQKAPEKRKAAVISLGTGALAVTNASSTDRFVIKADDYIRHVLCQGGKCQRTYLEWLSVCNPLRKIKGKMPLFKLLIMRGVSFKETCLPMIDRIKAMGKTEEALTLLESVVLNKSLKKRIERIREALNSQVQVADSQASSKNKKPCIEV